MIYKTFRLLIYAVPLSSLILGRGVTMYFYMWLCAMVFSLLYSNVVSIIPWQYWTYSGPGSQTKSSQFDLKFSLVFDSSKLRSGRIPVDLCVHVYVIKCVLSNSSSLYKSFQFINPPLYDRSYIGISKECAYNWPSSLFQQ